MFKKLTVILAVYAFFLFGVGIAIATFGLDPTFGENGLVLSDISEADDEIRDSVIQPDGKIVVAGFSSTNNGSTNQLTVSRYSPDGMLDVSFANDGIAVADFGLDVSTAHSLALFDDGRIIVVGNGDEGTNNGRDVVLAKYHADGTLDNSFGSGGKVVSSLSEEFDTAQAVAIQADGKIVIGGSLRNDNDNSLHFLVARYNPDGTLDTSFSSDGYLVSSIQQQSQAFDVAIQADDKIVVAGYSEPAATGFNSFYDMTITRYMPNGEADMGFGESGVAILDLNTDFDIANAVRLQSDNKIVVAGGTRIARLLSDGSLDTAFGANGVVNGFPAHDIIILADGKMVTAGTSSGSFSISRLLPNGMPDLEFAVDGQLMIDFGESARFYSIRQQGDALILSGYVELEEDNNQFAMARVVNDPVIESYRVFLPILSGAE